MKTNNTWILKSVLVSLAGIFIYSMILLFPAKDFADSDIRIVVLALAFQMGCYVFSWIILLYYLGGRLRFSDPAVLFLLWGGAFLIYPSLVWVRGGVFRYQFAMTLSNVISLFWLHGLFFLGFIVVHLVLRNKKPWMVSRYDLRQLPSGWFLFFCMLIPLGMSVLFRLLTIGQILPYDSYGSSWYDLQSTITAARSAGGISLLLTQIQSKVWFYPVLIQALGAGLILVYSIRRRQDFSRKVLLLFLILMLSLVLGSGGRGGVMIILIIALVFADMVARPLNWRRLFILFLGCLLFFEFYGYFRVFSTMGFESGISKAYQALQEDAVDGFQIRELTIMLSKEAVGLELFRTMPKEGFEFLLASLAAIIPNQFLPFRLDYAGVTSELLSLNLLEKQAEMGGGVAGAMIVDGYRFGGPIGVFLLGGILGAIFAIAQNWLVRDMKDDRGLIPLKCLLIAGFYANIYQVFRGSLGYVFSICFFNVIVPWIFLHHFLSRSKFRYWITPLSLSKFKRKSPQMLEAIHPLPLSQKHLDAGFPSE